MSSFVHQGTMDFLDTTDSQRRGFLFMWIPQNNTILQVRLLGIKYQIIRKNKTNLIAFVRDQTKAGVSIMKPDFSN